MNLVRNRKFNAWLQLITADVCKVGFPHASSDSCLSAFFLFFCMVYSFLYYHCVLVPTALFSTMISAGVIVKCP